MNEVREQFDSFAAHVRTDRGPGPGGRPVSVDGRVMAAIYESAETGRRVEL